MEENKEKIYKMNKIAGLIGHPFKVMAGPYPVMKTNYDFFKEYKENLIFRETDDGKFQKYDKDSKQWVDDDRKKYWYETDKGKRNYVMDNSNFLIKFKKPTNIESWAGDLISKKVDTCYIELTGTENFGQTKRLLSKLNEAEALGHNKENVFIRMEKNGRAYDFQIDSIDSSKPSEVSAEQGNKTFSAPKLPADKSPLDSINRKISPELLKAIETMKENNYTYQQVWEVLTDPKYEANIPEEIAEQIMKEHFSDLEK